MYLVLLETSGNQDFIFSTNKLRENVGASELTYRATTQWVLQTDESLNDLWPADGDAHSLWQNLLKQEPLSTLKKGVEVIIATSGKAMLLVESRERGVEIIRGATKRALLEAPGLDLCGVISEEFDLALNKLGDVIQDLHKELDEFRDHRRGVALRFQRLPVVAECATSGLPAAFWDPGRQNGERAAARSRVSLSKRGHVKRYELRMQTLLTRHAVKPKFEKNIDRLEKYCDWLAVVHADANGIGQILRDFWSTSQCEDDLETTTLERVNRSYIDLYRKFSVALDVCTEEAFVDALKKLVARNDQLRSLKPIKDQREDVIPVLPIVLGGDDLTVVCDGQAALRFTHDFLREFERQSNHLKVDNQFLQDQLHSVIPQITLALRIPRLSACAGVAIVKPHYPFSAGYDLSAQLVESAKQVKRHVRQPDNGGMSYPCSALDFHTHYDSSGSDLNKIRNSLRVGDDLLYTRPYVVTPQEWLSQSDSSHDWARRHSWENLEARVNTIVTKDEEGRRVLPGSQLHELRSGLFLGRDNADARYRLIRQRYLHDGIVSFDEFDTEHGISLFYFEEESSENLKPLYRTLLLDALDASNFWIAADSPVEEIATQEVS